MGSEEAEIDRLIAQEGVKRCQSHAILGPNRSQSCGPAIAQNDVRLPAGRIVRCSPLSWLRFSGRCGDAEIGAHGTYGSRSRTSRSGTRARRCSGKAGWIGQDRGVDRPPHGQEQQAVWAAKPHLAPRTGQTGSKTSMSMPRCGPRSWSTPTR